MWGLGEGIARGGGVAGAVRGWSGFGRGLSGESYLTRSP